MTDWIRDWVLGLTAAALVCAAALELTPKGPVKGVTKAVCGIVLALAMLRPLLRLDSAAWALHMAEYRAAAEALTGEGLALPERLDRSGIERELEAYILAKAEALGAPLRGAQVTLRWNTAGVWTPVAVSLEGPEHPALADWIEAELGLGRSAQTWRDDEGLEAG